MKAKQEAQKVAELPVGERTDAIKDVLKRVHLDFREKMDTRNLFGKKSSPDALVALWKEQNEWWKAFCYHLDVFQKHTGPIAREEWFYETCVALVPEFKLLLPEPKWMPRV